MLKPWITQEVLKKCDQRDELLKKYKNEKKNPVIASQIYKDYKYLRNQIKDKRRNKKAHNIAQFDRNKNSFLLSEKVFLGHL